MQKKVNIFMRLWYMLLDFMSVEHKMTKVYPEEMLREMVRHETTPQVIYDTCARMVINDPLFEGRDLNDIIDIYLDYLINEDLFALDMGVFIEFKRLGITLKDWAVHECLEAKNIAKFPRNIEFKDLNSLSFSSMKGQILSMRQLYSSLRLNGL